jgi:DNA-binding response OmpR family regulator
MDKWKVLVVEDDAPVRHLITVSLSAEDYNVLASNTAAEAVQLAATQNPDMILLDLGLPDGDGVEVIGKVRSWTETPIIVISARDKDTDKIEALDAGADDYLTKPFVTGELLARVRALTRRKGEIVDEHRLDYNGLELNKNTCSVMWQGNDVKLSLKEYQIMELLISNPHQILPKERIIEKIWGYESDVDYNNIEVYISFLRKKLNAISAPAQIKTARSIGYSLE